MKFNDHISFFIILFLWGCISDHQLRSAKVLKDGEQILFGQINTSQLFYDYPDWRIEYENYQVDTLALAQVENDSGLAVEIFFGTWCDDSQREVPRFLKINDRHRFLPADSMRLYAVDRSKQLNSNLCSTRHIEKVATFIFYRQGREIGRIIEYPQDALEKDISQILEIE